MKRLFLPALLYVLFSVSCSQEYTPKPRGYFRIDFPEKSYKKINTSLPYSFEIADYSKIKIDSQGRGTDWVNVTTPANNADLHITYVPLHDDLANHIEDSRDLVYDHTIKASAIEEQVFINEQKNVYGTVYYIEGNAASPMQFFLTDSNKNFIRGALYIREIPNIDSIKPVIDFLEPDIVHLIETTEWNN